MEETSVLREISLNLASAAVSVAAVRLLGLSAGIRNEG